MQHCVLPFTQIQLSSKVKSQAAEFVKSKKLTPLVDVAIIAIIAIISNNIAGCLE